MSLAELLVVIIVGVFILKPEDLRYVVKNVRNFTKYLGRIKDEIFSSIDEDEDKDQINNYMKKILSIDGKYEGEYDLPSIKAYYHKLLIKQHKKDLE